MSDSPWLTTKDAAARLRVSTKTIYFAVERGDLRAARIGAGRSLRFLAAWIDDYAIARSAVTEVNSKAVPR